MPPFSSSQASHSKREHETLSQTMGPLQAKLQSAQQELAQLRDVMRQKDKILRERGLI